VSIPFAARAYPVEWLDGEALVKVPSETAAKGKRPPMRL
jgi:hypothetical protein